MTSSLKTTVNFSQRQMTKQNNLCIQLDHAHISWAHKLHNSVKPTISNIVLCATEADVD